MLRQLGGTAVNLTHIGEDDREAYLSLCSADGIPVDWIPAPGGVRHCHTAIDQTTGEVTEFVEPGDQVNTTVESRLHERARVLMPDYEWVVATGSKAPGFGPEAYAAVLETAAGAGKRIALDIRGEDLKHALTFRPELVKINVPEFLTTFQPGAKGTEQALGERDRTYIHRKLREFYETHGTVFVLSHAANATIFVNDKGVRELPPEQITPVNTIGCGDAFMAGVVTALDRGQTIDQAVGFAHRCAAYNACRLKPGTLEGMEVPT
jgi:1-phosphofructokinase/tagatose 6-phosphate kinase